MQFKPNYPIYLQVADFVCEKVLTKMWSNGEKLPSVKDLSILTSVNPNTVIKSLTYLQSFGVVNTQRGVGYFLEQDALDKVLLLKKEQFIKEDLPDLFSSMELLNISMSELNEYYEKRKPKNE